jgi:hypothetical protein
MPRNQALKPAMQETGKNSEQALSWRNTPDPFREFLDWLSEENLNFERIAQQAEEIQKRRDFTVCRVF